GNSKSIYGCDYSGVDKPEYGRITRKGKKIYYHVMENPIGFVALRGINKEEIKKVRLLATGTEIKIADSWITRNYPNVVFISFGPNPQMPDAIDTVVEVELK
ncbi:MAG: alpha-L-fucosidase, partial [Niameybacter sp.]